MYNIIMGILIVIISFAAGIAAGYFIMKTYFQKRFVSAAVKCRDDDSFEPLITEIEEIS
ncbi:hypothetical protein [Methanochimaera problematica]|uniref:hypothetical protein n=1 Tax=Methanochimaera problematica TaxID=2609417 RepID=UPI002938E816|nr:hypothetical protein [Methanoplanus sp. FWC-SCC4]